MLECSPILLIVAGIVWLITCYHDGKEAQAKGQARQAKERARAEAERQRKERAMANLRF
jgi:hypothetical protein